MTANAAQLLSSFQAVQEQRSKLYSQLAAGFKQYLATKEELAYQALLSQTTKGFADCSQQVISLEGQLASDVVGRADLASLLRRVQEGEREKLQVTISLQALRTAIALRDEREQHLKAQHQQQQDTAFSAAHATHAHGPGCCGHDHDDDLGDGIAEAAAPAMADEAVREALVRLDNCVQTINDTLEEIKYALEDLQDG